MRTDFRRTRERQSDRLSIAYGYNENGKMSSGVRAFTGRKVFAAGRAAKAARPSAFPKEFRKASAAEHFAYGKMLLSEKPEKGFSDGG